jgi:dihydrolipoamide dehydrogenase
MKKYDLIVIGSGPGGYVSAIRSAQLGLKTAIIEKYPSLGGTCLNVGCIPSKAILDSSERFFSANKHFSEHGIHFNNVNFDIKKMMERKDKIVKQTCNGLNFLMKKNKIDIYKGIASFQNKYTITVNSDKSSNEIQSEYFIIATGSKPTELPGIKNDKKRIISSTQALSLKEVPNELIIIGGGVIGIELGSVYARLGTKIKVLEYSDCLINSFDKSLSKELKKILIKNLSFDIQLNFEVKTVKSAGNKVIITGLNKNKEEIIYKTDYCLLSVGRSPYTKGLNLNKIGIKLSPSGKIIVDNNLKTNIPNIFAIGDVIDGPMLAHKAEEEGVYVAEYISGQKPHLNYNLIPNVIYSWPEVASVGKTEQEIISSGIKYKVGEFPFKALGRARVSGDLDGFVKVLADEVSDEILGVHMIGPRVADLISEAVVAMEYRASAEDIARICHAHPTFSEAIKEAALNATEKRALHI